MLLLVEPIATLPPSTRIAGLPVFVRLARAARAAGLDVLVLRSPDEVPRDRPFLYVRSDVTFHRGLLTRLAAVDVGHGEIVRVGDARASVHLVGPEGGARFARELEAGRGPRFDRELALDTAEFVLPVRTDRERTEADEAHFLSLRKPTAGLIDRYFLRDLARPLTRLLVPTRVSPNAVTLTAFAMVAAAAVFAHHGGGASRVAALALLLLARVVDCVDGELARLRYETSKLGEWLDGTLDNVGIALVLVGLALRAEPGLPQIVAWTSVGAWGAACAVLALALHHVDSGAFQAIGWSHRDPGRGGLAGIVARFEWMLQIDAISLWVGLALIARLDFALLAGFLVVGSVTTVYGANQLCSGRVRLREAAVRR